MPLTYSPRSTSSICTISACNMIAKRADVFALRTTWIGAFHASRVRGIVAFVLGADLPRHQTARAAVTPDVPREGFHEGKEANAVQGDSADARREGPVPDRRWRAEWQQHPAERRTEQLPEHEGVWLLLTRPRTTGYR